MDTQTFIDVMKKHVSPEQIAAIIREFVEADDGYRCAVCGGSDYPVNMNGDEMADLDSGDFFDWKTHHESDCPVELLEKLVQETSV